MAVVESIPERIRFPAHRKACLITVCSRRKRSMRTNSSHIFRATIASRNWQTSPSSPCKRYMVTSLKAFASIISFSLSRLAKTFHRKKQARNAGEAVVILIGGGVGAAVELSQPKLSLVDDGEDEEMNISKRERMVISLGKSFRSV